jgi:hypothetical protein
MAKQPEPVTKAGEHTVVSVGDSTRDWKNKADKEMRSYAVQFKAPDGSSHGNVELAQLPTTAPPVAGAKIDGHIERRFYTKKDGTEGSALQFKKAARGGGGGGGRPWKPRPDDAPPVYAAKQAQIVAQHSQNMAIRVLELAEATAARTGNEDWTGIMADLGVSLEPPEGSDKPLGLVDAFQRHASMAAANAWLREQEKGAVAKAMEAVS